ncbi:MAG: hypothetical protein R3F11_33370, partial [Verrucomicrobiales bacterium]
MNAAFEPDPGVVLGGASGSFIGYLPQSADLTNGRGIARLRDGVFAVSGLGGVVQLLTWNDAELRFEVARRLGAFTGVNAVALDAAGTIWTPRGSWRWTDTPEEPLTLGDKEPEVTAQPAVLGGKSLCLLKKHYQYVQLAHGPPIDASGWSRLDTQGVPDFDLPESVTGAAAVIEGERHRLVFATREGAAFELPIGSDGQIAGKPEPAQIPGIAGCTSLAWFGDRLLAAVPGAVLAFARAGDHAWRAAGSLGDLGSGELHLHSDGARLAVSDSGGGRVHLFAALESKLATYDGLNSPGAVAVAGDRIAVIERGRQRLARLEFVADPAAPSTFADAKAPPAPDAAARFSEADFHDLSRPAGIPVAVAVAVDPKAGLSLAIRTEAGAKLQLGVAGADRAFILTNAQAKQAGGRFDFRLPPGDWSGLRIAAAIESAGGQRERFGFRDRRAIHAAFDPDPAAWSAFDLESYRELAQTRRQEIRLTFDQPMAGEAT